MCWEGFINFCHDFYECLLRLCESFFNWLRSCFPFEPDPEASDLADDFTGSDSSTSTKIVDPLREGTSNDILESSEEALFNLPSGFLYKKKSDKKKKAKGASKSVKSAENFVVPISKTSPRSKSEPALKGAGKTGKQKADTAVDIECKDDFELVKDRRSRKNKPRDKVSASTSAIPTVPLREQQKTDFQSSNENLRSARREVSIKQSISEPSSSSNFRSTEERESKQVSEGISYAQIASNLSRSTGGIITTVNERSRIPISQSAQTFSGIEEPYRQSLQAPRSPDSNQTDKRAEEQTHEQVENAVSIESETHKSKCLSASLEQEPRQVEDAARTLAETEPAQPESQTKQDTSTAPPEEISNSSKSGGTDSDSGKSYNPFEAEQKKSSIQKDIEQICKKYNESLTRAKENAEYSGHFSWIQRGIQTTNRIIEPIYEESSAGSSASDHLPSLPSTWGNEDFLNQVYGNNTSVRQELKKAFRDRDSQNTLTDINSDILDSDSSRSSGLSKRNVKKTHPSPTESQEDSKGESSRNEPQEDRSSRERSDVESIDISSRERSDVESIDRSSRGRSEEGSTESSVSDRAALRGDLFRADSEESRGSSGKGSGSRKDSFPEDSGSGKGSLQDSGSRQGSLEEGSGSGKGSLQGGDSRQGSLEEGSGIGKGTLQDSGTKQKSLEEETGSGKGSLQDSGSRQGSLEEKSGREKDFLQDSISRKESLQEVSVSGRGSLQDTGSRKGSIEDSVSIKSSLQYSGSREYSLQEDIGSTTDSLEEGRKGSLEEDSGDSKRDSPKEDIVSEITSVDDITFRVASLREDSGNKKDSTEGDSKKKAQGISTEDQPIPSTSKGQTGGVFDEKSQSINTEDSTEGSSSVSFPSEEIAAHFLFGRQPCDDLGPSSGETINEPPPSEGGTVSEARSGEFSSIIDPISNLELGSSSVFTSSSSSTPESERARIAEVEYDFKRRYMPHFGLFPHSESEDSSLSVCEFPHVRLVKKKKKKEGTLQSTSETTGSPRNASLVPAPAEELDFEEREAIPVPQQAIPGSSTAQGVVSAAEEIVSEEIQEEEKVIQEVPEVENEACFGVPNQSDCFGNRFLAYSSETEFKDFNKMPVSTRDCPKIPPSKKNIEMQNDRQIRVLTLNDNGFQDSTLYRMEKNWLVEFRLGPTLFGRKICIYCNFPGEENGKLKSFVRSNYRMLEFMHDEGCENSDDTALYAQIKCTIAGSFHFYYTNRERVGENKICGSGYFLVDPVIQYGVSETLPLDCIQCQTVISKQLGSFSTWEDKLMVSKESGYNMIHFTPVQALGASNSAYSLQDQLVLNPAFKKANGAMPTLGELQIFIDKMRKDWKVTSICDIVLNHTANESAWIVEHPEVAYNCQNCSYMRPAYLLDAALHLFSMDVKNGMYETRGIPPQVDSEDHLNSMRYHLREVVLKELKLHELYTCDVNSYVVQFLDMARQITPEKEAKSGVALKILQDPEYKRLSSIIDMNMAMKIYNIYRPGCFDEDSRLRKCSEEFKRTLDSLNQEKCKQIDEHLDVAVNNIISGTRYWRVAPEGPRISEITLKNPLIFRYFTDYGSPKSVKEYENIMYSDKGKYLMAHNGWIMNGDPLVNFAGPQSDVYIRRELVAWGDSVKLRFGDKPEDCPFLWEHMRKYVELTATIFDGVRLDNCHSTPIHVAEYLLDCARKVRPDLYVVAELFTNSDEKDNIFVNRLGISSLIREALNAWNSHEQGRLVYRFGGVPVGSFYQPNTRPLVPSIAHALFLDLTHDNESPVVKRSVFDLLPSAALVNMACCGTGSTRGYDELVPHQISVVDETREYKEWKVGNIGENQRYVNINSGIIAAKRALNDLHYKLGFDGFNQVYVDQMDPDVVAVTRHCPKTHTSYILVAFTAFGHPGENDHKWQRNIRPMVVEGVLDEIVLEATLSNVEFDNGGSKYARPKEFENDGSYINGYSEYKVKMQQNIQLENSEVFEKGSSENPNELVLNFKNFKPGSVVIIKVSLHESIAHVVKEVRSLTNQFSVTKETELGTIIKKLTLQDLNRALYRCDQEERDEGKGFDTYDIPNFGKLVYSGLQGFMSLLSKIRPNNDLGHPMCSNLRQGDWMIDYISQRLKSDEGTAELGVWIEKNTACLKALPRYLKPAYFDMIVTGIYVMLINHSHNSMSSFVSKGSIFVKALSMGSLQFSAYIKSADLPTLSPNLASPKPSTRLDERGRSVQACVSLSAGLPHFSVGYMRNWGRDTFIALRGLLILTGRHQEARYHILGYGACLRHGLIPNLLDGGRKPRFNCRDAVWWWLYCIKCYTEDVPDGVKILEDKVSRIFPEDDSVPHSPGEADQTLQDVMQEALNKHFQGVVFRERNAGREIDEHMKDNGFNNQIGVHPETGFVFGGNADNCGTWMDKMGSSDKAGNRGRPATPRDGSACEIVGLSKCVVSWLGSLHKAKKYKYEGVERKHPNGNLTKWTYEMWADKIQGNFEKYFWINKEPTEGELRPDLINKRGIYKDCHGASQEWTDFQLRCNFPIVMVVAPELFDPKNAWLALQQVENYLLGPLGMKTLDPGDWAYKGDYDNSNDSSDALVSHGFNYHQGPEWVWPIGYFLRAKLYFAAKNNKLEETIAQTKYKLSKHFTELQTSDWKGLPELTNSNGSYCNDSSRTQAWSMSSVLEVLYDLQRIESNVK